MSWLAGFLAYLGTLFGFGSGPAHPPAQRPPATYLVAPSILSDEKAVSATIETATLVPARARIEGVVSQLKVRQGDHVARGQVIAVVDDQKLDLEISSFDAQVQAARSRFTEAKAAYDRAQRLVGSGVVSQNQYDEYRSAYQVALNELKSRAAEHAVASERVRQGRVVAPAPGRVLTIPVAVGSVVMPGEAVATLTDGSFVLRLEVPERHAGMLKAGETVRVDCGDIGGGGACLGTIGLIYPKLDNGRVMADVTASGVGDYFVGKRVRVWVPTGRRQAIIVPGNYIQTRFGIDYARLWTAHAGAMDVPVQRGEAVNQRSGAPGMEILSGLRPGDRLLVP